MGEAARRGKLLRVAREAAIQTALGELHDHASILECEACGAARARMEAIACVGKEAEILLLGDDSRQKACPVSGKHIHLRCACRHVMLERWASDAENAPLVGAPLDDVQLDETLSALDVLAILCGENPGGFVIPALSIAKFGAGWYAAIEVSKSDGGALLLRAQKNAGPPADAESPAEDVPGPDEKDSAITVSS